MLNLYVMIKQFLHFQLAQTICKATYFSDYSAPILEVFDSAYRTIKETN